MNKETFWLQDPRILIRNPTQFFPRKEFSQIKRLNTSTRGIIYTSIVLAIYYSDKRYLLLGAIGCLISVVLYRSIEHVENMENEGCRPPTKDNPFANANYIDRSTELKPYVDACNPLNPETAKEMDDLFESHLYRDVSDVYKSIGGRNSFYTTPSAVIPNDRESFQNWLCKTDSCKSDPSACSVYQDPRNGARVEL